MKINIRAPICDTGYGVASRNIVCALHQLGVDVSLWPIGTIRCAEKERGIIQSSIQKQENYSPVAPSIVLFHQFSLAEHVGKGPHIGFPIFELDKFTPREIHHLSNQDHLFVCSKWAKNIIINSIKENYKAWKCDVDRKPFHNPDWSQQYFDSKIHVVPLGVDRDIFYNSSHTSNPNKTVFLTVGKWEIRKGHDFLIKCFDKAFSPKDNAVLWLCTYNPFLNKDNVLKWQDLINSCKNKDNIIVVPYQNTQEDLAKLMWASDIGVFPARAEGWNLELLEMMSVGKNVICTNFSAHTEFVNELNSNLIDISNTESAYDGIWFHGQGSWANLDDCEEQCVMLMRKLHQQKENGVLTENTHGITTAKHFSWENTAKQIFKLLE
jgi:glycosyltransferase involved in cell wall biosynthesis